MKNSITQLHSLTPLELEEIFIRAFKKELEDLKQGFQPKHPVEFLTRQQTADLLHIDLSTLWSWTKKGKLKAYSISSRVYYKRKEVEESFVEVNH